MPKNSEIMDFILKTIIKAIGRRTTINFAIVTIHTVIKKLELKYDFLRYIEIDYRNYSEGINAVQINKEIDSVESSNLGEAVNEIIDAITKRLKEDPSYYFITEIKDKIESEFGSLDKEFGIDLDLKQLKYLFYKIDRIKISEASVKNSYVVELVLKAIIKLLNKKVSESEAIKVLKTSIKKLENTSDILRYIMINDTPNSDGYYTIETKLDIDNVSSIKIVETFEKLIEEIGISTVWKTEPNFLEEFQSVLGDEGLFVVKKIGVRLDHIETALRQQEHELITKKTLKILIDLTSKKTSVGYAVETVDSIIKNVKLRHGVLKHITIDNSRYDEGVNAILINAEINSVESYELGKALWEVIRKIKEIDGDINFIEDFKKKLGSEYLQKIEGIGINLHLLEMTR